MKKVVRLTESDLVRLVKRVIMEQTQTSFTLNGVELFPNRTYNMTRSIDNKVYQVTIKEIIKDSTGKLSYILADIPNLGGQKELSFMQDGTIGGNMQLGSFSIRN
jgi:hypothetical protein